MKKGPKLDSQKKFKLSANGGGWITMLTPFTVDKDESKARLFSGLFLNTTMWDWADDCKAVEAKPKVKNESKPKAKKSKH